jgi:hypothetical protein
MSASLPSPLSVVVTLSLTSSLEGKYNVKENLLGEEPSLSGLDEASQGRNTLG